MGTPAGTSKGQESGPFPRPGEQRGSGQRREREASGTKALLLQNSVSSLETCPITPATPQASPKHLGPRLPASAPPPHSHRAARGLPFPLANVKTRGKIYTTENPPLWPFLSVQQGMSRRRTASHAHDTSRQALTPSPLSFPSNPHSSCYACDLDSSGRLSEVAPDSTRPSVTGFFYVAPWPPGPSGCGPSYVRQNDTPRYGQATLSRSLPLLMDAGLLLPPGRCD